MSSARSPGLACRDPACAGPLDDDGVVLTGTLPSMGASTGRSASDSKTGRDAASIISSLDDASSNTNQPSTERARPRSLVRSSARWLFTRCAYLSNAGPAKPRDGSHNGQPKSQTVTPVTLNLRHPPGPLGSSGGLRSHGGDGPECPRGRWPCAGKTPGRDPGTTLTRKNIRMNAPLEVELQPTADIVVFGRVVSQTNTVNKSDSASTPAEEVSRSLRGRTDGTPNGQCCPHKGLALFVRCLRKDHREEP